MLHRIDKENIDFVKVLPELLWLRVAVLLAPSDLLKLRSLSKKFTKYVNTNLVWASYSWYDFLYLFYFLFYFLKFYLLFIYLDNININFLGGILGI